MPAIPLRAALSCAMEEETIARNPAAVIRLAAPRKGRRGWWTAEEARRFLENARNADDSLYAGYVLVLVLGLRRGEALGLPWELVNLDAGELYVEEQVQRVGGQLVRRPTKTELSEASLPMPGLATKDR